MKNLLLITTITLTTNLFSQEIKDARERVQSEDQVFSVGNCTTPVIQENALGDLVAVSSYSVTKCEAYNDYQYEVSGKFWNKKRERLEDATEVDGYEAVTKSISVSRNVAKSLSKEVDDIDLDGNPIKKTVRYSSYLDKLNAKRNAKEVCNLKAENERLKKTEFENLDCKL